jgi:hypothetical protein
MRKQEKEKSNHWWGAAPLSATWTSAKNPEDLVAAGPGIGNAPNTAD